ncbi:MAG: hypothetical protein IJX50_00310 [Clostridia bacterium]|nr:hypothetical protein [Clostridia bacterium]
MADRSERTYLWKGLNRMPYIADGEMRNMKNLSSDAYPFITTRKGRKPYTLAIRIPSSEGEAYKDIDVLPEPDINEVGNIYRLAAGALELPEYTSGGFYYWNGSAWIEGYYDSKFLGAVTSVIGSTLVADQYNVGTFGHATSIFNNSNVTLDYSGRKVKYLGEDSGMFLKGKTYIYRLEVEGYWEADSNVRSDYGDFPIPPTPSVDLAGRSFYYTGETKDGYAYGTWYKCYLRGSGYWEECESCYDVVETMPENPETGLQVRFIERPSGAPNLKYYYLCQYETDREGTPIYYYKRVSSIETGVECEDSTYLPETSAENEGKFFNYTGASTAGQFEKCCYEEFKYVWKEVSHPKVLRTVTVQEYLDKYDGRGLDEILEIANFRESPAVLFIDKQKKTCLYYEQNVWEINNLSYKTGKKLIPIGDRIIVGEAGSYLKIKDGSNIFFQTAESFSQTVRASYAPYGNGQSKYLDSQISGTAGGDAHFKIIAPGGEGVGFETVYNGLNKAGTNFKAVFDGKTYYMTVKSVTYEKNKNIAGWTTGSKWHYDYADELIIEATNCTASFEWNDTRGFGKQILFESTDPHYYDVAAWKKRLWAYDGNVFFGTAADIFKDDGHIDWNRGDNTNLEAISQPLWQGGDITGIAALMNGLVYLKRDCITVVTGNYTAIMSSNTIPCRGLPPENRRSVAVINESVYYLSNDGVYRFDGGIPRCISRDAKITGTEAVGAGDGNKYYLSLKEPNGDYVLYVYDVNRETWHKEDNTRVISFAMLDGEMYMAVEKEIYNINAPQEKVDWECELWYDEGTHRKKRYKEFHMRGNVGHCEFFLKADGGEWKFIAAQEGQFSIKIPPFECEELSVLIKGEGICEIKSLDRVFDVD